MAAMTSLTRISRLALAAALLIPTTAHASELTPDAPVLGDDFLLVEFGGGLGTSHFGT